MRSASAWASCSLLASLCAGCAAQAPKPAAPEVPAAFERAAPGAASWPSSGWYRGFASAELDALIGEAASHNFDLATARARVAQADARARQAHASILPSIDVGAAGNYLAGRSDNGSGHETDWAALLSASYEVDFWGKHRAVADSARLLAQAARADHDTVALTTLAGVADGYFQVLSLRERLAVARANRDAARRLMGIVDARYAAGLASPFEVASQRTALAAAELAGVPLGVAHAFNLAETDEHELAGALVVSLADWKAKRRTSSGSLACPPSRVGASLRSSSTDAFQISRTTPAPRARSSRSTHGATISRWATSA